MQKLSDVLNYLYYGSGHLHHINFNGETITDIERDNLHRPIVRSAGQLNTQFQFDPMGRLKQQISQLAQYDSSNQSALIGRQYHYDTTGNLIRTDDKLNGNTDYAYDPLGRILQAADERFAFDPAHNISDDGQTVMGNRLMEYNGVRYRYDGLGNLTERHSDTESQFYHYDANNQLIEARIEKATMPTQYWQYRYDPFGRRMLKINAKTKQETLFTWEGSRLLQELRQDKVYTYVYTEQNSYEPLAQIQSFRQPEKHKTDVKPIIYYYHTDQIGIPREMTDEEGNIIWTGKYDAWGSLKMETKSKDDVHQPFRLQNQYADEETGLYYNFFRYYDAHCGRFTQQDPIGLLGGENLYAFAPNAQQWVDPLGLEIFECVAINKTGGGNGEIEIDGEFRKICTYQCTSINKCSNKITLQSHSSMNANGSEFCRGSNLIETVSPNGNIVTQNKSNDLFHSFKIDTDSWWDSWGRTKDLQQKLKQSQNRQCK